MLNSPGLDQMALLKREIPSVRHKTGLLPLAFWSTASPSFLTILIQPAKDIYNFTSEENCTVHDIKIKPTCLYYSTNQPTTIDTKQ